MCVCVYMHICIYIYYIIYMLYIAYIRNMTSQTKKQKILYENVFYIKYIYIYICIIL